MRFSRDFVYIVSRSTERLFLVAKLQTLVLNGRILPQNEGWDGLHKLDETRFVSEEIGQ